MHTLFIERNELKRKYEKRKLSFIYAQRSSFQCSPSPPALSPPTLATHSFTISAEERPTGQAGEARRKYRVKVVETFAMNHHSKKISILKVLIRGEQLASR